MCIVYRKYVLKLKIEFILQIENLVTDKPPAPRQPEKVFDYSYPVINI